MSIAQTKKELRIALRAARKSLAPEAQAESALRLCNMVRPVISPSVTPRIALYLAEDGELSAEPLIHYCWQHRISVYLPVLNPLNKKMWFAHYTPRSRMTPNRYGILEPLEGNPIHPWQLSVVMFPLVGFDANCARLGMGGGFYDRVFANQHLWPRKPSLFGIAHECQKVDRIPREAWDIPLDGVFSDRQCYLRNPV